MKKTTLRLVRADRPSVIAVFGGTRAEVECAIRHARTATAHLPIMAWCAESCDESAAPPEGCERFTQGVGPFENPPGFRDIWPALTIVAWTGGNGGWSLKVRPLLRAPFRAVLFNEVEGFFPARPLPIAVHLKWRLRDAVVAKLQLARDLVHGAFQWSGSATVRTGRRLCDLFGLLRSLAWRSFERSRDMVCLLGSFAWRTGEKVRDLANLIRESTYAALDRAAASVAPWAVATTARARRDALRRYQIAPEPSDYTEVAIRDRGWPRKAILAAAHSGAEFIVLRQRGEAGSPSTLIELARETGAFAVAKQTEHSAWRTNAIGRHPFRRLQPGEVAEVVAPFSSLLVLRRETLLRLGIPRGLSYGGALAVLFWKASSAGLRSLTTGHPGNVHDESAMALEDAELAVRLRASRYLAALRPHDPWRTRGNLAWSPAHRRGFRGKPRVLVVSPYLPFPLSHGGAVRIYNLCRSLADRCDFILACFREAGETVHYAELHEVFREVYVVDADERYQDASLPTQVLEYRNSAMSGLVRSLCQDGAVDLVQLEYTQVAEYREAAGSVPVILVEHDITFTLYDQLAGFSGDTKTRRDYLRWHDFERTALQCADAVWTMSTDERNVALANGATERRVRVIPNGVDLRRFTPSPRVSGPPVVLFVGSFRHLPNLLAFEALRESVMPMVWRAVPDVTLHVIAGPRHRRAAELAGKAHLLEEHPGIVVDGFVEDVRPAYQAASVVAVPLPLSAGTNIKMLEAMASQRAIVSTPAGCQGLGLTPGVELIVAEDPSEFAAGVVGLLRDEHLRGRMASAARATAERRFGWDRIAEHAFDSYLELIQPDREYAGTGEPITSSANPGRESSTRPFGVIA